ncbi:MAG TPA: flavoprotein, partial [Gammaproteobacteria bacterium]|nr:flavoprotein [Gammaproteobacteria bacterium]
MSFLAKGSINTVTLGFTGASGVQYGLGLLAQLVRLDKKIALLISQAAMQVFSAETELRLPDNAKAISQYFAKRYNAKPGQIVVYEKDDWLAPIASGSNANDAMVICPCSTGSLSAIALGASNNLLERAADVMLKEG